MYIKWVKNLNNKEKNLKNWWEGEGDEGRGARSPCCGPCCVRTPCTRLYPPTLPPYSFTPPAPPSCSFVPPCTSPPCSPRTCSLLCSFVPSPVLRSYPLCSFEPRALPSCSFVPPCARSFPPRFPCCCRCRCRCCCAYAFAGFLVRVRQPRTCLPLCGTLPVTEQLAFYYVFCTYLSILDSIYLQNKLIVSFDICQSVELT
jgi:hypothetical protein